MAVAILLATLVTATFAAVVLWPIVREPGAPVPIPTARSASGRCRPPVPPCSQIVHRGGVVARRGARAARRPRPGYAALATGLACGVTYAVLQAFTVSLPHLAGSEAISSGAEAVLHRLAPSSSPSCSRSAAGGRLGSTGSCRRCSARTTATRSTPSARCSAIVVLAPLGSLLVQAAALRLRPEVALANGVAAAAAFVAVGLVAVPAWGATGGTLAALAGIAAGLVVSLRLLPGAASGWLSAASLLGAAAVFAAAGLS